MDNYKLKFENGRSCTIECDSNQSFQDKINDAENRFNSECCEINGKPIKKHSLGGFVVGATIGAILGNSVPAKTISKTATGVKRTAKNVAKKVQKEVKKFSGGGNIPKIYEVGIDEGDKGTHTIADFTTEKEAKSFMYDYQLKNPKAKLFIDSVTTDFLNSQKFSDGGSTDDEKYCRVADDTGKGINEGYVVGDGEMYFATEDGLYKHLKALDYVDADGKSTKKIKDRDDLLDYFFNDEYYYWTEWDCEQEIEDQGYYYTADGKEIAIASKGKKVPEGKAPRSWNKDVREYMFFVWNTKSNKVWAGNEYEEDAKDELKEFLLDNPALPLKVLSKRAITNKKINPLAWENWSRSTEIFAEIKGENPEQMAKGSKVKSETNNTRIKALVKDLEDTPYSIGLAILRERVLTYSENDLKSLEKNPKAWENGIVSLGMYKDYYTRCAKELSFEPRKDNSKAVKDLVKDLDNTPHSIGLAILRERLLSYAENDLKSMDKNPDAWGNPFISLGMYKDYANRVIEHLKFEFATGGDIGSLAMAGAVPELAIADQVSKRLPATTSALDRRIASQIDPDRPKWYEDRGMKYDKGGILDDYQEEMFQEWLEDGNVIQVEKGVYATQDAQYRNRIKGMDGLRKYVLKEFWSDSSYAKGGKVGDNITFRHWAGDIQKGSINEDLGDGNFDVSSGFGRVLVNREDIISVDKEPIERKKLFGLFENGGNTPFDTLDYDYEDIGQFSVPDADWKKYSQEDFNRMGRKIVAEKYKGNLGLAYNEIVHKNFSGSSSNSDELFWVMTGKYATGKPQKYFVMRGDYMTKFNYPTKAEAEAKAKLLIAKSKRN